MPERIATRFGHAIPPAPRHSVTVHMPGWDTVESYGSNSSKVIASFSNVYPRMKPHKDIADLETAVLHCLNLEGHGCFVFASLQSAQECVDYCVSSRRNDGMGKTPIPLNRIGIRALRAKDLFLAVVYPIDKRSVIAGFWSTPGVGVSSRFAEANLRSLDKLTEVPLPRSAESRPSFDSWEHANLRTRITQYLDGSDDSLLPCSDDVYLFPTGMAAVYKPHTYLLKAAPGATVLFGMAFMNTLTAFEEFGASYKFFGLGTDVDLEDLARFLDHEYQSGRKVQAIWAEFPANPLLVTPNLSRLRAMATQYDVLLAIDDTIASWANVDITRVADLTVTSLTKSFNGYADVIAGSVVLNPGGSRYKELKTLFSENYVPELYLDDVQALERNSRDYLERSAKLNSNAAMLVKYLATCAQDRNSAVRQVHYPSTNASGKHYTEFIRSPHDGFTPGYGCLFSIELDDLQTTQAFYDNLEIHKGPHLGAPLTLAFAYTMCAYKNKLEWAARYGLKPTQIRISAGLEEPETLLDIFTHAVEEANKVKRNGTL